MGYSFCMMADFQNVIISPIFGVFPSGFFCTEQLLMICKMAFNIFLRILSFDLN